ncbi:histidine triad nucleotide-binding protein [Xylanibacillus composti]|uniref:histidine triad nucleotide-binding protein n=1 Tax=Xylanibacillus composti TaxID=1572762 RepID=UPI0028F58A8D|nr:histidine triad nucleotide-binding protein [Xylanibacillus composti]MDT9724435.1 histidine triad nucleotide-binding protein [Xylanibacillus composti]
MSDCIFCKIVKGELPSTKYYEDDRVIAFADIDPKAPVHILLAPKQHIPTMHDVKDFTIVADIHKAAQIVAEEQGIANGYRLINNCGADAGQIVFHLHYHLMGGEKLTSF